MLVFENSLVEFVCIIAWLIGPVVSLEGLSNCFAETGFAIAIYEQNFKDGLLLNLSVAVSIL